MDVGLIIAGNPAEKSQKYSPNWGLRNVFNVIGPFDGHYIRWSDGLPRKHFDVLFVVRDGVPLTAFPIEYLRAQYPEAKLVAYTKEKSPEYWMPPERIKHFQECDAVALPYRKEVLDIVASKIERQVFSMPYPYDIQDIYDNYFVPINKRKNTLFVAANPRRGLERSMKFAEGISSKYGYDIVENPKNVSWDKWLELVAQSKLVINLDTKPEIGQVGIEAAILGVPHVGGLPDSAQALWPPQPEGKPEDWGLLTNMVEYYLDNYVNIIVAGWNAVWRRHSFESARKNLENF